MLGLLVCLAAASAAEPPLPAFPGAEGFGAASTGGRGGKVLKVTNLNTSGPGSMQWACQQKGARIVVFDVSGVIDGDVTLGDGQITIAGQTAPGAGITINGMLRKPYSNWDKPKDDPARLIYHDITVRFLRCRPKGPRGSNGDCVQIGDADRLILDHLSVSWGSDENIDLCASRDITVQWCAIEESDQRRNPDSPPGGHNFGMIMGYEGKDATVHHNLFAHQANRTPLCGLDVLDHRNNVIYDCGIGLSWHPPRMNRRHPGEPFRANLVGDYFMDGPTKPKVADPSTFVAALIHAKYAKLFAEGNYFDWAGGYGDPWELCKKFRGVMDGNPPKAEQAFEAAPVTTQKAADAQKAVLAQAGCLPRDAVSRRTIQEVRTKTGAWGRHDPEGGLMAGLRPSEALADADGDGMPDAWETARGLDPKDPADATKIVPAGASENDRHKGYTYIEFYVNDVADRLIAAAVAESEKSAK